MTPGDASRLLIAVAGADFIKGSLIALRCFGQLLPIGYARGEGPHITLEDHVAGVLTRLASEAYDAGDSEGVERSGNLGLSLMSAASVESDKYPRLAISRWSRRGTRGMAAISFASSGWEEPVSSESQFAVQIKGSGLIRQKHVTIEAMEMIARIL